MSSRIYCWLHGHDWGPWKRAENIAALAGNHDVFGVRKRYRDCRQCGARHIPW